LGKTELNPVNNSLMNMRGGHRTQILDSKIGLKKGWHPIKVDYCQLGLAKSLNLTWEGPGVKFQMVPANALFH